MIAMITVDQLVVAMIGSFILGSVAVGAAVIGCWNAWGPKK